MFYVSTRYETNLPNVNIQLHQRAMRTVIIICVDILLDSRVEQLVLVLY